jgi:hypothetical protein
LAYHNPIDLSKPYTILVDSSGKRFVNEATSYVRVGIAMYERHKTVPAVPSWMVVDSHYLHRYRWGCGAFPAGAPPKSWIDSGYMKRGDTIANAESLRKASRRRSSASTVLRATGRIPISARARAPITGTGGTPR